MQLKQYQIDAFTKQIFSGNPAAVCPLEHWLPDDLLQAIAAENNLSETAFFVPSTRGYALRWFTPVAEVDLCGHGTLATAHVLFHLLGYTGDAITFETRSGHLIVQRDGDALVMDFPAVPPVRCDAPAALVDGLGVEPLEVWAAGDYMAVLDREESVRRLKPDQTLLSQLDLRGVIVTAAGSDVDFVSRFFAPKYGIPEDPVTGSAHCILTPYWAERLGKQTLTARQLSARGGEIGCVLRGDRVLLSGHAVVFMVGEIYLP
jgi:PhzF family phenazine biosynthesis protein